LVEILFRGVGADNTLDLYILTAKEALKALPLRGYSSPSKFAFGDQDPSLIKPNTG